MQSINHTQSRRGGPRLWIFETLVVFGVLVFGYLAMTPDWGDRNPLVEFLR